MISNGFVELQMKFTIPSSSPHVPKVNFSTLNDPGGNIFVMLAISLSPADLLASKL